MKARIDAVRTGGMVKTSSASPIRVDFVDDEAHGLPGRLGLTIAPGKCDFGWERNLAADIRRLRNHYHTDVLVSLIEPHEYELLRIVELPDAAKRAGISVVTLPIPDVSVPASIEECQSTVRDVIAALSEGKTVVVHCRGGLGRSGLLAACCLVTCGLSAEAAIAAVREARPGAVEAPEQERFVERFAQARAKTSLPG